MTPDLVCAIEWYTAPGTVAQVLEGLRSRLHNFAGSSTDTGVSFLYSRDLQIGATQVGDYVGLIVSVQLEWRRSRPESSLLGSYSGSVAITVSESTGFQSCADP